MAAIVDKCNAFSTCFLTKTEHLFYRLGFTIAKNPWKTILFCWLFVFVSVLGLFRFHQEKNPLKLWVPPNSNYYHDTNWLMRTFQMGVRPQIMIISAPNVLTPYILEQAALITQEVREIKTKSNITWSDVCFRVPVVNVPFFHSSSMRNKSKDFDPSLDLHPDLYCMIVDNMDTGCLELNLLDVWKFEKRKFKYLTKQDILNDVNSIQVDPLLGHTFDYGQLLGDVKRNSSGHIVAAGALVTYWMAYVDFTQVDMDISGNEVGTADWATEEGLQWEQAYLDKMKIISQNAIGFNIVYEASRSFGDVSGSTMFQDMDHLAIGIFLMIIYVQLILSNFNWIEYRFILGSVGLLCVGMAFISACGICSLLGISYGPVHTSLPFLLMGLGVDDMFVMMASWNHLPGSSEKAHLPERVGKMLQHAGMSITVTSFTDVLAFLIGASTILPSLESFCLYAAVGVFLTFAFAITFFTACFVLDQQRVEQKRNCLFIWRKQTDYVYPECSHRNYSSHIFEAVYKNIILTTPGKVVVLLITVVTAGISFESAIKLEQRFDPNWFIPKHTYLHSYITERNRNFPLMGYEASIFMGSLNYSQEFYKIHEMIEDLARNDEILNGVDSWTGPFLKYARKINPVFDPENITETQWRTYISKFLMSPHGGKYQANFRFDDKLQCGKPAPNITVASVNFRFNVFNHPDETLPAMHLVQDIVQNYTFESGDQFSTAWAKIFGNWITDEVIHIEVMRNLLLALICVMFCTILLITNFQMCWWIFLCVLLTMLNVCGYMQRWGLTIDLVACIGLELAIGLCVDFATHIGHTFLTITSGSRNERAVKTVSHIGAAIFYGGGSTLLALSMLSQSDAYVFQSFFKIFILVIVFGLFHGVVFLPVILSMIGPKPYKHTQEKQTVPGDDCEVLQSMVLTNGVSNKTMEIIPQQNDTVKT